MPTEPVGRFFSRPLGEQDRWIILDALGLGDLSFLFYELAGDLVLRARKVQGRKVVPQLMPVRLKPPISATEDCPVVVMHFSQGRLPSEALFPKQGLWATLFPTPFSRLSALLSHRQECEFEIHPPSFRQALVELLQAFSELEVPLKRLEFSCLYLKGKTQSLALLVRCEKHRNLTVGRASIVEDLAKKYEGGELSKADLQVLGLPSCFFPLSVSSPPPDILRDLASATKALALGSQTVSSL